MSTTTVEAPPTRIRVGATETVVVDPRPDAAETPLLMLHGVPDTAEMWRPLIDRLPDRRCVAPDLHGLGRGTAPRDLDLSLEARAAWVAGVLDALSIDGPVDLIVHDFGGPTGLAWACEHPERVRRLIVMATCFHREWRWHALGRAYRAPLVGEVITAMQTAPLIGWPLFVREMRRGSPGLPLDFIRESYDRIGADTARQVLRLYRQTPSSLFEGWDTRLFALVEQRPTLALWSDRDPYVPVEFALKLVARGARLHRFDDVGHWMQVEAPDRVAALVGPFLI